MSLFSSIQIANNALVAAQIGIQVAGNNIANANTPGYIRERVVLSPAPSQKVGSLLLGLGVQVDGIVQQVDLFLEERLRGATSDLVNGETLEDTYLQLEALVGELGDTDISTSLTNFFGSINDILNQPESISIRNLSVLQGSTLADDIRRLDSRVRDLRIDVNNRIVNSASDINRLLNKISQLNVQIVTAEGGGTSGSDAVGLRDNRQSALGELASLVDIQAKEQPTGDVTVFAGGEFLVFQGTFREVTTVFNTNRGLAVADIRLAETDSPLSASSGKLGGLVEARDQVLGGFLDQLNTFAQSLSFEFNKVYSGGQGLTGYTDLTSEFTVDDTTLALDQTGLAFTPVNGSFQIKVLNKQTGLTKTTDIFIDLNGLDNDDTTLTNLTTALNAINGISAQTTPSRGLSITSDSANVEFTFANDTSGVLAALGLNTFFSGSTSSDISINSVVRSDPSKFSVSSNGIGEDTNVAVLLAGFLDTSLASQGGASLADSYSRLAGDMTQAASVSRAVAEGFRVFQRTLKGQQLAISGVSIDEEAIKMITFQRSFQASARMIATISEMLDILVNL